MPIMPLPPPQKSVLGKPPPSKPQSAEDGYISMDNTFDSMVIGPEQRRQQELNSLGGNEPPVLEAPSQLMPSRSFKTLGETDDARRGRNKVTTSLVTSQGTMTIDDLDVPEDVKELLFDLDFDASGEVSKEELQNIGNHLTNLHKELGAGSSNEKVCELLDLVIRQVHRKNENASYMEYRHLPEKLQHCFRVWDVDGDGRVDAKELMGAADAWTKLQKESAFMKKLLFAACNLIVLMFAGMFAMGMVTAELAKEFKAGGSGTNQRMTSKSGDTIQVASSDTQIDSNGMLMTRAGVANNTQNGRDSAGLATGSVATMLAKSKTRLVSTLPDAFWNSLDEISVHSERGHKLSLKIQGFARIPLRHSRCGNVLKLYTSVDGAVVFDSDDMSFEGKLDTLFKNAGFEVAVGGAAGRRLASTASVDAFFNHVSKAESEGSWKCGDIPLPRMPAYSIQKFDTYSACKWPDPDSGKSQKTSCDSMYGGHTIGVVNLPAEHASATLSRLDKVQAALVNGKIRNPTQQGTLYTKTSKVLLKSPSYTVQRTTSEGHPGQELFQVTGLPDKKSVSFQQMYTAPDDSAIRNFCKEADAGKAPNDPVLKDNAARQDVSKDTSVHFEYVGLEGEGDKIYRRFRMLPAKDFNAWMGTEGVGQVPSSTYHYWDEADDELFTPYRLVTPFGEIYVYTEVSQTATDADVEAVLKNTVNATKFGSFAKPYKFECGDAERGSANSEFGFVPEMSLRGDLPLDDVQFWARYIFDQYRVGEVDLDPDSGDTHAMMWAARDGNDTSQFWKPAFTFLATIGPASADYSFAKYALRSQEKLAMPSVCSEPCIETREIQLVQDYLDEKGDDEICSAPYVSKLIDCITTLDTHVALYCTQSPFYNRYQMSCKQQKETGNSRRLQVGGAKVDQLSDGTHSLDLGSLDHTGRMFLSAAISASEKSNSLADLEGYRLLFNTSGMGGPTQQHLLSNFESSASVSSRRLGEAECGNNGGNNGGNDDGMCYEFKLPKTAAWTTQCKEACKQITQGVPNAYNADCSAKIRAYCSMKLKFKMMPPYWAPTASFSNWIFSMELGGSVPMLQILFGLANPPSPFFGDVNFGGGVSYSNTASCPHIPYYLSGYAYIGAAFGVRCCGTSINAFSISLKVGAETSVQTAASWHTRADRRRGYDWRRRRGISWQPHHRPYVCQVEVYAKIVTTVAIVKGWLKMTIGLANHVLSYDAGAEVWLPFVGWDSFWAANLITTTL